MRRATRYPVVIVLAALFAAVGGCQQVTPAQRLAVANDTFATTLDYLSDAREAGRIDDETQVNVIAPARRTVVALLDSASAAVAAGDEQRASRVLADVERQLTPLLWARQRAEEE